MTSDQRESVSESTKIGPFAAGVIVAGNMLGSGIYLLPATLGAIGSATIVGWAIAVAAALVLALACSMLALLRPAEPGVTGYISSALGRTVGFHASYIYWISVVLGNGAIALAAASYLVRVLPIGGTPAIIMWAAILLILLSTLINIRGAKSVARFGGASLAIGLAPVAVIAIGGITSFDAGLFRQSWNVSGQDTVSAVALSLPSIAWAFLGLESAGMAALVVRNPARNVPLATIGGVLAAGIVYMVMCAVIFGLAPAQELAASSAPLADVASRLWGSWMGLAVAACAAIKASGTLAGWTLVGGEMAVSASHIGLFPRLGRNGRATLLAYLAIGGIIMAATTFLSRSHSVGEQFGILINSTTLLCLIVYTCCGAALLRLRIEFAPGGRRNLATFAGLGSILLSGALAAACDAILLGFAAAVIASGVLILALRRRSMPSIAPALEN